MNSLRKAGFTLIELLVAMAIFVVLIVLLYGVFDSVGGVVGKMAARKELSETGRHAMEWITRDLERIRPRVPGDLWSVTSGTNTNRPSVQMGAQFLIASNQVAQSFRNPHAMYWQVADDWGSGRDLAAVGYFVQWIQDGNTRRPVLSRLSVAQTNAAYQDLYSTNAASTNAAWVNDALLSSNAPAVGPTYRGWFADNVFSIWFRALDAAGNPIRQNAASVVFPSGSFDSRQGYRFGSNSIPGPALPAAIEVAVVVAAGKSLQGNTAVYPPAAGLGADPANFWSDIEASMAATNIPAPIRSTLRAYSTRIPLRYAQ